MNNSNRRLFFLIYSAFPKVVGGRETWLYHISKRLAESGFNASIISQYYARKEAKSKYKLDYRIGQVKIFSPRSLAIHDIPILVEIDMFLFSLLSSFYLLFKAKSNDVIYCMNPGFETLGPLLLKKFRKKIVVVSSIRGLWSWEMGLRYSRRKFPIAKIPQRILAYIESYTLQNADIVLSNGYDTKERYSPLTDKLIQVLPNGVDTTCFNSTKQASERKIKKIVTVASLSKIKGMNPLIESIAYLKEIYHQDFSVEIIGGGDVNPFLKYSDSLSVRKYVSFLGERRDIPELLQNADIVACLKDGGGISHSLLEAMASGKPIVAWNTRVYNQVLTNRVNSLLIEKDNTKKVAEAFFELFGDEELRKFLGKNALVESKKYDWNIIIERFVSLVFS